MSLPFQTDSFAQKITVKSAVNPSLWACAVISVPLFILASTSGDKLVVAFFIVATIPVVSFFLSYLYLLFKNPDYLRSEDYQIRAESLKLLGSKDNPLQAGANDIVSVVTNPQLPAPKEQE